MTGTLPKIIGVLTLKFIVSAAAVGALATPHVGRGQAPTLKAQVKATYLYNFIQFVEWPQAARTHGDEFRLCVLGGDRLGPALDAFDGEIVDGRAIRVRRLSAPEEVAPSQCRLVFLPRGSGDAGALLSRLPDHGVLTVGEGADFSSAGGMIRLYEVRGRVQFSINDRAARRAGLVVSSRLLQLARERL